MPWLRVGDTSITHPVVLRALELEEADGRTLWELFGFVTACAIHAAGHKTDYVVELGTIRSIAGLSEAPRLIKSAIACGYFTEVQGEDGRKAYKIIDDPELFHMRLKEDIEWENRQRNDTRNKTLIVPIRKRDGDACRWCGKVVFWGDQKGPRGATYDHIKPGHGAVTPDDMVVACRSCNSSRKNDVFAWANRAPLPVPDEPRYGQKTARFLADNGEPVKEIYALPIEVKTGERFVPVEPTGEVDSAEVEPAPVEPETLAPEATGPKAVDSSPDEAPEEETYEIDFERMDEDLEDAPDWVQEANAQCTEVVESPTVEPETLAPASETPTIAPWATAPNKSADLSHSESLAISRATDLDMPGRDGTERGNPLVKNNPALPPETSNPDEEKKRRRRRRRRKKKTDEE